MKRLFFILAVVVIMCSCGPYIGYSFYQVYKATPVDANNISNTATGMVYEDANCAIIYSFWAENGNAGFSVLNKTDKVLFIDMNQSFFIRNGITYDYYLEAEEKREEPSHIFRPIVAIPPKAYRSIAAQAIFDQLFVDCDLDRFPSTTASMSFEEALSPLHFTNYLTYNFGEGTEDIVVENKFYISSITNYTKPSLYAFVERTEKPCVNKTSEYKKDYYPNYTTKVYDEVYQIDTSDCFFVKYEKRSSRLLYKEQIYNLVYDSYYDGYVIRNGN